MRAGSVKYLDSICFGHLWMRKSYTLVKEHVQAFLQCVAVVARLVAAIRAGFAPYIYIYLAAILAADPPTTLIEPCQASTALPASGASRDEPRSLRSATRVAGTDLRSCYRR